MSYRKLTSVYLLSKIETAGNPCPYFDNRIPETIAMLERKNHHGKIQAARSHQLENAGESSLSMGIGQQPE